MDAWTVDDVKGLLQLLGGLWCFCWIVAGRTCMRTLLKGSGGWLK
jgi:hypothetical protein